MTTVLHIAAHMGGGVGKVLSNVALVKGEYEHHIVLLEKPMDTIFTDRLSKSELTIAPSIDVIRELATWADIVQFDWWNHPLLAGTMYKLRDIPMRSVVWSHTAGCHYPYIKPDFVTMPDCFIFSSKYSKDNPHWTMADKNKMKSTCVVNSSGGFEDTQYVPLKEHEGFNVGYVGTLAYVKMLPEFVEWCKSISDIPGIKFILIGRIPEPNLVLRDAEKAGIADKFVFKGYVKDLPAELAQLDVIGYLLNPMHFGTTENALLEAMSMGIPPVCIDQCAEKYLIENATDGFLVKSKREYSQIMKVLHSDPGFRRMVGEFSKFHVTNRLNLDNTINRLNVVYNNVMQNERRLVPVGKVFGDTPYEWYKSGTPPECADFSKYLTDSTKGSIAQWKKYYSEIP